MAQRARVERLVEAPAAEGEAKARGLTVRAVILAAIFTFLAAKWVQISELIVGGSLVSESVPPIPAVAVLILLAVAIPVLRKIMGKWALTHSEGMVIYAIVAVGVALMAWGGLSYFFGGVVTMFYFANPSNNLADIQKYIPSWMSPRNPTVITEFYESSYGQAVPWGAWIVPLLVWAGLLVALFFTMMCLVRIFYDYWVRQDRLTFPIVQMTTSLGYATVSQQGQPPFFRNPMVWIGLAVAFLFDGTNMAKCFNPDLPAIGNFYDLEPLIPAPPLSSLKPLFFRYDPSLLGMGYLMSADVLISVIVGVFFFKLLALSATVIGYPPKYFNKGGMSGGAFLVLVSSLVWTARRYLWQSFRRAFGLRSEEDGIPLSPRWAVMGTIVGAGLVFAFIFAWKVFLRMRGTDLSLWVPGGFFFLFLVFALGYARIRAETGAPMSWLFPYGQDNAMINTFFGTSGVGGGLRGGLPRVPANHVVMAELFFLSRSFFKTEMGVQVENFRIGEVTGAGKNTMAIAGLLGVLLGLGFGIYVHMTSFYTYGTLSIKVHNQTYVFDDAAKRIFKPGSFDLSLRPGYFLSTIVGIGVTAALVLARRSLFRFPLHPLGLVMGITFGDPLWGPFILAWLCKVATLNAGGMTLYRRLVPLFLGMVVGHYFAGGVVWGLLGLRGGDLYCNYKVFFGYQGFY